MSRRVAVLTGGGCAPGLDPFLETFTKFMFNEHIVVFGVLDGWAGLTGECPNCIQLGINEVDGLVHSGGTMLGTSRENPLKDGAIMRRVSDNLDHLGVEGLVAFGGDDTLNVANVLTEIGHTNVIGVPKTMDLDLAGTDYSVGFWGYNEEVFRHAIPGFITTLKSHRRVGVVELFGRYSGFTTVAAGLASGACFIAIVEQELDLDLVKARVEEFYARNRWALVVVGEAVEIETADKGQIDPHGHELLHEKRIGEFFAREIARLTGLETCHFQAKHPFRGVPSAFDAVAGVRLGVKAAEMVRDGVWNKLIAFKNDNLVEVGLGTFKPRRVITPDSWWWNLVELRNCGKI